MMARIAAFAVLSLILSVTPGPDSLLVLRRSLLAGRRVGALVTAGATSGSLAWEICSAAGLTAILAASAQPPRPASRSSSAAAQFLAGLGRDRDGPLDALNYHLDPLALIRLGFVIVIAPSLVPALTPPVMYRQEIRKGDR